MPEVSLEDLPFTRSQTEQTFRWPTLEDLKALNLKEPLKLTEIRVKGVDSTLTAIQLVFKNGVESPLFDSKHARATRIWTYNVPN